MKFFGRTTRPSELDRCIDMVRDGFLYDAETRVDLRKMWHDVLSRDVGRSAVIFEADRPDRVLAFGVSAALTESKFDAIESTRAPFIAKSLLDDWRRGDDPFLDEASFATANGGEGLHLITLHNGVDESIGVRFLPDVLSVMSENFLTQHAGCNIKAFIHESFGVPPEFAINLGMRILPYASSSTGDLAAVPPDRKPTIITMTRADAERHRGNLVMYQTFLRFSQPRCRLANAERRLLRYALEGLPDDAIADILEIAPRTLKKRWADVYAAMEPVTGISPGGESGRRGAEVRRHVLRYVRQHPEELHAYSAETRQRPQQLGRGAPIDGAPRGFARPELETSIAAAMPVSENLER
jgi:hypothetical protein